MSDETATMEALVKQVQACAPGSMEQLIRELRPRIYRYCLARLLDPHAADDVTQEVTVAMTTAVPRYVDQGRSFTAFVLGIAANKVSEARRSRRRRPEDQVEVWPDVATDPSEGPESVVLRLETSREVAALLARLPDMQAEILRLRVAAGLSAEEVGELVGMTANAVRVTQHRALNRLRALREEIADE